MLNFKGLSMPRIWMAGIPQMESHFWSGNFNLVDKLVLPPTPKLVFWDIMTRPTEHLRLNDLKLGRWSSNQNSSQLTGKDYFGTEGLRYHRFCPTTYKGGTIFKGGTPWSLGILCHSIQTPPSMLPALCKEVIAGPDSEITIHLM